MSTNAPLNIVVINGSPQGHKSVTIRYVYYLQKHYPMHQWQVFHIAEKSVQLLDDKMQKALISADLIVWAFPVYYFCMPALLKDFIEKSEDKGFNKLFEGKHTCCVTSSIKISDTTAHQAINSLADLWGMNCLAGYSAEINDIYRAVERKRLRTYASCLFDEVGCFTTVPTAPKELLNVEASSNFKNMPQQAPYNFKGNVSVIHCETPGSEDLILWLRQVVPLGVFADISQINYAPCNGCLMCTYDNRCIQKDAYRSFFDSYLGNATCIIFVCATRDIFINARWKAFFDRMFFSNHTMPLKGRYIGFILHGPLHNPKLTFEITEKLSAGQGAIYAGTVRPADCDDSHAALNKMLTHMAVMSTHAYEPPQAFTNVSFDLIIKKYMRLELAPVFWADYKFYRRKIDFKVFFKYLYFWFRNVFFFTILAIPVARKIFYKNIKNYTYRKMDSVIKKQ